MKRLFLPLLASSALLALTTAAPALAAGNASDGLQEMRDWNLILLGSASSSSEVEGNTFIGGSLGGGSSNYYTKPQGALTPGLVVAGSVSSQIHINNSGGAEIGGSEAGSIDLNGNNQALIIGGSAQDINGSNGSTITVGAGSVGGYFNQNGASFSSTLPANFSANLQTQGAQYGQDLNALSQYFKGLTQTDSYTISPSNQINFSPASAGKVAVFDLSSTAALSGIGSINFSTNGFDTVIVNVGGTSDSFSGINFVGSPSGLGQHVIWNFYDATSLNINTAFYGSVLAPKAAGTTSNFIEGSAVFSSLTQNGEVHMKTYDGGFTIPGVPEPSTWAMMLLGVAGVGAMARSARRHQGAAAAA